MSSLWRNAVGPAWRAESRLQNRPPRRTRAPLSFDRRSSAAHNSIDPAGASPALGVVCRFPGSHIRRARGATLGRESPEVRCRAARPLGVVVGWSRGASNPGAAASSESLQRRDGRPPRPPLGVLNANCGNLGAPSPLEQGEGQRLRGRNRTSAPAGLPRRRGGGTKERIDVSKWGRSAAQPRPDRMAKTRRITAREVAERAATGG